MTKAKHFTVTKVERFEINITKRGMVPKKTAEREDSALGPVPPERKTELACMEPRIAEAKLKSSRSAQISTLQRLSSPPLGHNPAPEEKNISYRNLDSKKMCESENKHFYLCVLEILALLGLLALVLWLSLRPKSPSYTIVDITIPNSALENGAQNGSIVYILEIENSNKDSSIYYDTSLLTFYYGQDEVGEKSIAPFHQGRGKTRSELGVINANAQVWRAVRNSISNATAEFKVTLLTKIRYKTWGIKSKIHGRDLQGTIPIGKDGKLSGKKKKIKLSHASKKLRRNSRRILD